MLVLIFVALAINIIEVNIERCCIRFETNFCYLGVKNDKKLVIRRIYPTIRRISNILFLNVL